MSFGQRDNESGAPINNQDISEKTNGVNTKLTKKDSTFPFDLRNSGDLSLYSATSKNVLSEVICVLLRRRRRIKKALAFVSARYIRNSEAFSEH